MEYITTAEAARRLSVSKATIYRRISDGSIPVCRLAAKTVRIKAADLDAYMASKVEQN
ncbi:helix-turn-helix domain-containing protein [Oscillibacter sp.]|uniref:helix-turn-helix transcriptional regulator n=1 Tax=Oscillibacter sp. TaxID=1945593 RepID=UPI0028A00538|nr:helix-turn-helix domain-containing protein [Oscillibacter sp.]